MLEPVHTSPFWLATARHLLCALRHCAAEWQAEDLALLLAGRPDLLDPVLALARRVRWEIRHAATPDARGQALRLLIERVLLDERTRQAFRVAWHWALGEKEVPR